MFGISEHRSGVFTGSVPQLFVRGDPLEIVFDDVGVAARAAELEVGAGPSVLEAVAGVAVEDVAPTGVEHGLGEFPQLRPQFLELVAGDVEHLAMKHARLEVLLLEPLLEGFVVLRQLALGAALAGFRLGDQLRPAGLEFGFGLTLALTQLGLDQDVVDDAADRDAEGLLQVPGVEDDLEIGPQPLQVAGVDLRGGFVFQ